MRPIFPAGLLPEGRKLSGVLVTNTLHGAHHRKHDRPKGNERQVTLASYKRAAESRWVEPSKQLRSRGPIDQLDHDVQYRNRQQLIVELRRPCALQRPVEGDVAESVECAEDHASQLRTGRGGRIGEQEVHSKKDRYRNIRIEEEIDAGCTVVREAK